MENTRKKWRQQMKVGGIFAERVYDLVDRLGFPARVI